MDEGDAIAGDAVLRLAAAEHAHAVAGEGARGVLDVIDAETEVMNAALRIALEKFGDRRIRPRWLHQFDLPGAKLDVGEAHALLVVHHARSHLQSVSLAQLPRRYFEIRHDDRDMAQSGDHVLKSPSRRAIRRSPFHPIPARPPGFRRYAGRASAARAAPSRPCRKT